MHVTVIGDGKVGHLLADSLAREGHDVVIVDRSEVALRKSVDTLDVLCVRGNGANIETLMEARADKAEIFIAATTEDETNMLCCLISYLYLNPQIHRKQCLIYLPPIRRKD